jgi:RNA polymerase sigma-70 factor (ECF subfamily)
VGRALAGHEDGFRGLVARHQRPVYNLVVRIVGDRALAEDLAQEAFIRAFSHLKAFDPRYKFSNWILRIAHNAAIDALRRRGPGLISLDADADGPPLSQSLVATDDVDAERLVERADLAEALEGALARLRPEYRRVVVLRYHEELSHEEISTVTGLPVGTVKSYLHRARAEMAGLLAANGWGRPATREAGTA